MNDLILRIFGKLSYEYSNKTLLYVRKTPGRNPHESGRWNYNPSVTPTQTAKGRVVFATHISTRKPLTVSIFAVAFRPLQSTAKMAAVCVSFYGALPRASASSKE